MIGYNRNTGDRNTGNRNTGDRNTGNRNTGDSNTGHRNTGDSNTGNNNTGDSNTGNRNTGDSNTGHRNTGDSNTGHRNTGYSNTGHRNTGNWNCTNRSAGVFCQVEPCVISFDVETDMTHDDFMEKYGHLCGKLGDDLMQDTPIDFCKYADIPFITEEKLKSLHQKMIAARKG